MKTFKLHFFLLYSNSGQDKDKVDFSWQKGGDIDPAELLIELPLELKTMKIGGEKKRRTKVSLLRMSFQRLPFVSKLLTVKVISSHNNIVIQNIL